MIKRAFAAALFAVVLVGCAGVEEEPGPEPDPGGRGDLDGQAVIVGTGIEPCAAYVRALDGIRDGDLGEANRMALFLGFAQGWVSARNAFITGSQNWLGATPWAEFKSLLDEHCTRHPEQSFFEAVERVVQALP
jgi:hypothetical protein